MTQLNMLVEGITVDVSRVNNIIITTSDYLTVLPVVESASYYIEYFCLKEVRENSIIFESKLSIFGKEKSEIVNLVVSAGGELNYILIN